MFTLSSKDCAVIKAAKPIVKSEIVSIRARNGVVLFCLHNRATGALFLHKIKSLTKTESEFGIECDRFNALLNKPEITFDFNGSVLTCRSGRTKVVIETAKPFFEDWPSINKTGVPLKEVMDNFSFIDLKSKHHNVYVFGGAVNGIDAVAAGDRDHGVFLPLQKSSEFAIPLSSLQSARRLFKGSVNVLVDTGTVYFQQRSETIMSLLRFGQMGDTDPLNLQTFYDFREMQNKWTARIDASLLSSILKDYSAIQDVERDGIVTITIQNNSLKAVTKTKHGETDLEEKVEGNNATVRLNANLLHDILRLEGSLKMGVKENGHLFFIENPCGTYFSAVC